jgi:hypothetical protein
MENQFKRKGFPDLAKKRCIVRVLKSGSCAIPSCLKVLFLELVNTVEVLEVLRIPVYGSLQTLLQAYFGVKTD